MRADDSPLEPAAAPTAAARIAAGRVGTALRRLAGARRGAPAALAGALSLADADSAARMEAIAVAVSESERQARARLVDLAEALTGSDADACRAVLTALPTLRPDQIERVADIYTADRLTDRAIAQLRARIESLRENINAGEGTPITARRRAPAPPAAPQAGSSPIDAAVEDAMARVNALPEPALVDRAAGAAAKRTGS